MRPQVSFWIALFIAVIVSAVVAVIVSSLFRHPSYGCPPGQHLIYMVPSDPGYSPGLQECR